MQDSAVHKYFFPLNIIQDYRPATHNNPPPKKIQDISNEFVVIDDDEQFFDCLNDEEPKYNPITHIDLNKGEQKILIADKEVLLKPNYLNKSSLLDSIYGNIIHYKQYLDLKHTINTLYGSHKPGKYIKGIMSFGIVQMTVTSILYNPYLFLGFAVYLGYVYIQDKAKPELNFQNTKVTIGAGALLFNYISPFIFDPAQNTFLFMTYLYFSLGAFGVLTSSNNKTIFLSRISAITGVNAFVIDNPIAYLGVLTLLHGGYFDDIVNQNAPFSNLYIKTVKDIAQASKTDYLVTISDILRESFKLTLSIPYDFVKRQLVVRQISAEFTKVD